MNEHKRGIVYDREYDREYENENMIKRIWIWKWEVDHPYMISVYDRR